MQDRMHLDCVFSILGDDICLMLEEMMGEDSKTKRLVDEYTRDTITGAYGLSRENIEFSRYMRENGYHIVPIKPQHQLVSSFPASKSDCHFFQGIGKSATLPFSVLLCSVHRACLSWHSPKDGFEAPLQHQKRRGKDTSSRAMPLPRY